MIHMVDIRKAKALLVEAGLTQKDIARLLQKNIGTVNRMFNDSTGKYLSAQDLAMMSNVLGRKAVLDVFVKDG